MAKFDPQPTLNPWTDRHQIWNTWLSRGYLLPKQIWAQSAPEGTSLRRTASYDAKIGLTGSSLGALMKLKKVVNIRRLWAYISRMWGQNPLGDISETFASNRGFWGRAIEWGETKSTATNPSCHGNEIWDKIGYNSACTRDISENFASVMGLSRSGYRMMSIKF